MRRTRRHLLRADRYASRDHAAEVAWSTWYRGDHVAAGRIHVVQGHLSVVLVERRDGHPHDLSFVDVDGNVVTVCLGCDFRARACSRCRIRFGVVCGARRRRPNEGKGKRGADGTSGCRWGTPTRCGVPAADGTGYGIGHGATCCRTADRDDKGGCAGRLRDAVASGSWERSHHFPQSTRSGAGWREPDRVVEPGDSPMRYESVQRHVVNPPNAAMHTRTGIVTLSNDMTPSLRPTRYAE